MDIHNFFNKFPARTKILMAVTLAVIIIWIFTIQIIMPMLKKEGILKEDISKHNIRVEELKKQMNLVVEQARGLERIEEEYRLTREKLEIAQRQLPEGKNISELLRQISSTEKAGKVILDSLTPLPAESKEEYLALPLKIYLKGDFVSLARYLKYLEDLPRLVIISSIILEGRNDKEGLLSAHISGATYVLNE